MVLPAKFIPQLRVSPVVRVEPVRRAFVIVYAVLKETEFGFGC